MPTWLTESVVKITFVGARLAVAVATFAASVNSIDPEPGVAFSATAAALI